MILFSTFLISTIVTILTIPIVVNLARKFNILDFPDSRKIHCEPTPRIGGIAMVIGAFIPIFIWAPMDNFVKSLIIGSGILITFGLIDDVRNLGYRVKFTAQILAALIVILYGGLRINGLGLFTASSVMLPEAVSIPLTLLTIVAVTNAINLSDGLDGLAGGMALLTFLFVGYLAYLVKFQAYEVVTAAFIGSLFGLLRFNTYPAKVFMGDTGSQMLGFVAITLSLAITNQSDDISPILLLLVIGVPIIDTIFVMINRVIEGRSPFSADKSHLHHRLIGLGFYHTEAVVLIYISHLFLVCSAFILKYQPEWLILTFYIVSAGTLPLLIIVADHSGWQAKRYPFIDNMIKGPLRRLREENVIIKVAFRTAEIGFGALLILICLLPRHINMYMSYFASAALAVFVMAWLIKKEWSYFLLEAAFFLIIPFIAYYSEADFTYFSPHTLKNIYMVAFGGLVLSVLVTLKFTRRNGFKSNPLDFLILAMALVIPNLPDTDIQNWQMGFVATKIIVFYFTYEVLKGELRLSNRKLGLTSITTLLIIGIRGILG